MRGASVRYGALRRSCSAVAPAGEKSAEEYAIEILWKHFGEVAAGLDVDDVIAAGKTGGKRKRKATMGEDASDDEVIDGA